MNREQKYIAHIMFKNKVLQSNGNAFEAFFSQIMTCANVNFQQVKPQGSIGDRKNDGFDKTTGTYYQVYAPENISTKEKTALEKLSTDFNGLYKYWQDICPIRRFFFVINDKFNGGYPSLHNELAKIQAAHPEVEANLFLSKDLENICFQLSDEYFDTCLGFIPETYYGSVDYDILNDVVSYLLSNPVNPTKEFIPINPNFEEKIKFNGLSDAIARYLTSYRINEYCIDDFLKYNSSYTKEALRNIFTSLYHEALNEIEDAPDKPDLVFMYIFEHSFNKRSGAIDNAILTLMAYYFEYCDIFQAPEV